MSGFALSKPEADRQIELLRSPPPPSDLDRCCTVGDGIRLIADGERGELEEAWRRAAARGRFSKFVPASGAASRMFSMLAEVRAGGSPPLSELRRRGAGGDASAQDLIDLLERLRDLPFYEELAATRALERRDPAALAASDEYPRVLSLIADAEGLGYSTRAKGLIPFHRYEHGSRTAMEEHLVEGSSYVVDEAGRGRIHFTVSNSQRGAFERVAATSPFAADLEISFSTQHPSTGTLSLAPDGNPARASDGRPLLRPGGHGALLRNLQAFGGDLVYLKNIDNVLPQSRQAEVVVRQRLLGGLLVRLEEQARRLLQQLTRSEDAAALDEATRFCESELGREVAAEHDKSLAETLRSLLDRPIRVCGMVRNSGEPGGGPFWVRDASGASYPQIVESAQVDLTDSGQREIWRASTHFNPVMLVGALRRHDGTSHRLEDYVDARAVFVSQKPSEGRTLRVLEHPGLWNGAMAEWNTIFVEVPLSTFAPVKTILDLLRPEHQPRPSR